MATEWQTLLILTSRFPNKFEGILMIDRAFSFAVHRPFEMCLDPAASRRVWTAGGNRYNLGMSNSRGDTLGIPSGYVKIAIENDHRNSGFSHKQWWFSIVMWQFTRGYYGCLSGYLLVMFVPIRKKMLHLEVSSVALRGCRPSFVHNVWQNAGVVSWLQWRTFFESGK